MPEAELFLLFVRPLNRARIRYMIGGSVASIFYGEPRLTHDVDFVVSLDFSDIAVLTEIFPDTEFYVPPPEAIAEELRRNRGHFNLIHNATGFKADFYPAGRDSLNAWGFQFTREAHFEEETVVVAPPEYVIVRKLEYFREGGSDKHLRDIRSMLAVSREQIDFAQLNEWIQRLALDAEWRQVE
jgi:hypothetical protein